MAHRTLRQVIYSAGVTTLIGVFGSGGPSLLLAQDRGSIQASATVVSAQASFEGQQLASDRFTELTTRSDTQPLLSDQPVRTSSRIAMVRQDTRPVEPGPSQARPTVRLIVEFAAN
jgi:hypothetical protein